MTPVEARLIAWAHWRNEPGLVCLPDTTPLHRIKEDKRNAGAGASGFRYQMIDDTPCMPDGGVAAMVKRMGHALERDRRAREVEVLVSRHMPIDYVVVVRAIYVGYGAEIPRSLRSAANVIGISKTELCERRARVLGWVEAKLGLAIAA